MTNTGVAALARELGVAPGTITHHMKRGLTADQIRQTVGRVEHLKRGSQAAALKTGKPRALPAASIVQTTVIDDGEDEVDAVGSAGVEAESTTNAVRRKEIALANKQELEVAQRRGDLVPRVMVRAWISGMINRAKTELMRIGPELQDTLAVTKDAGKCGLLIEGRVRQALEALAQFEG